MTAHMWANPPDSKKSPREAEAPTQGRCLDHYDREVRVAVKAPLAPQLEDAAEKLPSWYLKTGSYASQGANSQQSGLQAQNCDTETFSALQTAADRASQERAAVLP